MRSLPTGTVTFLFTDIEGSTVLLQHLGDRRYADVLTAQRRLLRAAFQEGGGHEVDTQGDAFLVAFGRALDAVAAVAAAQRAITAHPWPEGASVRVRMGLHTGEPTLTAGGYVGLDVHRAARICAAGHGGQTLLSQATRDAVAHHLPAGVSLRDLGEHRLKDLQRREQIFQLLHPDLPADFPPLRSLDALPNNLPRQLTSFIGREREMAEVKRLLTTTRLLMLTGSGGCGKTRLALQVAADLVEEFANGVWLVELAALSDPALVPQSVASALGVREEPGRPLLATLSDYLQPKRLLLVLDNCEHLVEACAYLAEALLRGCPHLRILATSREALSMAGETAWRVPSLSLPDLRRLPSVEYLTRYEAVCLFIERALISRPEFALTSQGAPSVAQVCHRLDGIPLAIELAAARVKVLSVEQIAARLDDRFRLLTGGSRTALPRHQTLRAAIDWSYDLLSETERKVLRRLSVFAGGWTLEAAEAICVGEDIEWHEALDLLMQLVDKSLVLMEEQGGTVRYRLLETVRQYGREKLLESGEADVVGGRHRAWYLGLAERAEPELLGSNQATWLERLDTEHDNLRAALERCTADEGDAEAGLRLTAALWRFWYVRSYFAEGRQWITKLLAMPAASARTAARAKALNGAGNLAYNQGDYAAAQDLHEQSLAIRREVGDQQSVAGSLNNLALVARRRGDYVGARALLEEAIGINRMLGNRTWEAINLNNLGNVVHDRGNYAEARALQEESLAIFTDLGNEWGIGMSLCDLGNVVRDLGDTAGASVLYEESLARRRKVGDRRGMAISVAGLGDVAYTRSDYSLTRSYFEESLAIYRELGDRLGIIHSLEGFAGLAAAQAQPQRALRLSGAAASLREAIGAPLSPTEHARLAHRLEAARQTLSEEVTTELWTEGRAMTLEQAIAYALG
ncbi:MAG: ATP-binding protein [Armatimonadota bacterium]